MYKTIETQELTELKIVADSHVQALEKQVNHLIQLQKIYGKTEAVTLEVRKARDNLVNAIETSEAIEKVLETRNQIFRIKKAYGVN